MYKLFIAGVIFLILAVVTFIRCKDSETPYFFAVVACVVISVFCFIDGIRCNETKWVCCNQNNYYNYCSVCGEEKPVDSTKNWYCCDEKLDAKDNFCPKCGKENPLVVTTENTTDEEEIKERNEENKND